MTNTTQIAKAANLFVSVKNIKGTSFVGVQGYENKQGEISNQTFLVGINYTTLLKNDLQTLQNFDIATLTEKMDIETLTQAKTELIESLQKRLLSESEKEILLSQGDSTIVRSEAQNNAYLHLCKGLKLKGTELYIYGLMVRKQIVKAIEYKKVNSKPLTIAKNLITKAANLREGKFKQFMLGSAENINLKGITI